MIKVFYGDDRRRATEAARKFLGEKYEVVEGAELAPEDLPSLFLGGSLFSAERAILIRDFLGNREASEKIVDYLKTPHKVVILEMKLDKRANIYKNLKDKVEILEFKQGKNPESGAVFDVFKVAKRDGKRAVEMLEKVKDGQEPMMFLGLMASRAIRDYGARPGAKEKRVLAELSKLDIELKSSKQSPWLLLQAFLLRVSSL